MLDKASGHLAQFGKDAGRLASLAIDSSKFNAGLKDLDSGTVSAAADLLKLQANVASAQRALDGFKGVGGAAALKALIDNLHQAGQALNAFTAAKQEALRGAFNVPKAPPQNAAAETAAQAKKTSAGISPTARGIDEAESDRRQLLRAQGLAKVLERLRREKPNAPETTAAEEMLKKAQDAIAQRQQMKAGMPAIEVPAIKPPPAIQAPGIQPPPAVQAPAIKPPPKIEAPGIKAPPAPQMPEMKMPKMSIGIDADKALASLTTFKRGSIDAEAHLLKLKADADQARRALDLFDGSGGGAMLKALRDNLSQTENAFRQFSAAEKAAANANALAKGGDEAKAHLLRLKADVEDARKAMEQFRGAGGGEAFKGLQSDLAAAEAALKQFEGAEKAAAQGAALGFSRGGADAKAYLLRLKADLEQAQQALSDFKGAGGGTALKGLQDNVKQAEAALRQFQVSQRSSWGQTVADMQAVASGVGKIRSAVNTAIAPFQALRGVITNVVAAADRLPVVGKFFSVTQWGDPKFMISSMRETVMEMASMSKQATKLGMDFNTLAALEVALGGGAEGAQKGLFHLSALLSDAAHGSKEAADKFLRFGLDGKELANMGIAGALDAIAGKFVTLNSVTDKAGMAMALLHKTGAEVFPLLSKGAGGLEEARKRVEALGGGFSAKDLAEIQRAAKAFKDINIMTDNLKRSLAVEFAPILSMITEKFVQWKSNGGDLRSTFHTIATTMAKVFAGILRGIDSILEKMKDVKTLGIPVPTAQESAEAINKMTMEESRRFNKLDPNKDSDAGQINRMIRDKLRQASVAAEMAKQLDKFANEGPQVGEKEAGGAVPMVGSLQQAAEAARGLGGAMQDIGLMKVADDIGELQNKLIANVEAFGRTSDAVERFKLAHRGATAEQLKTIDALIAEAQTLKNLTETAAPGLNIFDQFLAKTREISIALQRGEISADGCAGAMRKVTEELNKSAASKAAEMFQQVATPLERAKAQLEEIQQLADRGLINAQTRTRAIGKTMMDLEGPLKQAEAQHAGAVQMGSQEAIKSFVEIQDRERRREDPVAQLQRAIDLQTQIQKAQLDQAKRIEDAIKAGKIKVADFR